MLSKNRDLCVLCATARQRKLQFCKENCFSGKLNSSDCFCGVHQKLECKFFTSSETSKQKRSAETYSRAWSWDIMISILILFGFHQKLKFSLENTRFFWPLHAPWVDTCMCVFSYICLSEKDISSLSIFYMALVKYLNLSNYKGQR